MIRLKEVMTERGITVSELARRLNTDTKQVRRFLAQGADIKLSTLAKIAQALEVEMKDLIIDPPLKRERLSD